MEYFQKKGKMRHFDLKELGAKGTFQETRIPCEENYRDESSAIRE